MFFPTHRKDRALRHLLDSWKRGLTLPRDYQTLRDMTDLPSYYCRTLAWRVREGENSPIILPNDAIDLRPGKAFAPWFLSLPTPEGRIKVPLRMSRENARLLHEVETADSLIVSKGGEFYVHLVVWKEASRPKISADGPVLAVDLGERVIATSVTLIDGTICDPKFHGRQVRGIRRHYAWLRRRLGERRLRQVIRRIGKTECRKVEDVLQKTSRAIVNEAARIGAVVAVGDLTGLTKRRNRGKRLNRIVCSMPYAKLTDMIEYKAGWAGIPVIRIREDYSSRECHVCLEWGRRPTQGRFLCSHCGEYNADLNAAINIGKRAMAYMAIVGAPGFEPERYAQTCQVPVGTTS